MKYSGLWFIPSPPNANDASTRTFNALIARLESQFPSATRLAPWVLAHRLLRSIPAPASTPTTSPPAYQHILQLSWLSQSKTFCYVQPMTTAIPTSSQSQPQSQNTVKLEPLSQAPTPQPQASSSTSTSPAPGCIVSIPTTQSDAHIAFLCTQFSPLWSFRQALQIQAGITYTIGPYLISLGEIRASRSGAAAGVQNTTSPGVVACVTILYPDQTGDQDSDSDDDEGFSFRGGEANGGGKTGVDLEVAEDKVRKVWEEVRTGIDFGKTEVKEVMMNKDKVKGEGEREAMVRMWCEILRLRA